MPEKTIREMSTLERRHYSLSARVFRSTLMGSVILGLVALAIGLGLYTGALIERDTSAAFLQSRAAASVLQRVAQVDRLAEFVMDVYNGMSEEERGAVDSGDYCARFNALQEDPDYLTARSILADFRNASEMSDIYLAMYTRDPSRLVYVVDPDENPQTMFAPGQWEEVATRDW